MSLAIFHDWGCPICSTIQRLASQLFLLGDPRPWSLRRNVGWECQEVPLCDNLTSVQNGNGYAFAPSTTVFQLWSPAPFISLYHFSLDLSTFSLSLWILSSECMKTLISYLKLSIWINHTSESIWAYHGMLRCVLWPLTGCDYISIPLMILFYFFP